MEHFRLKRRQPRFKGKVNKNGLNAVFFSCMFASVAHKAQQKCNDVFRSNTGTRFNYSKWLAWYKCFNTIVQNKSSSVSFFCVWKDCDFMHLIKFCFWYRAQCFFFVFINKFVCTTNTKFVRFKYNNNNNNAAQIVLALKMENTVMFINCNIRQWNRYYYYLNKLCMKCEAEYIFMDAAQFMMVLSNWNIMP